MTDDARMIAGMIADSLMTECDAHLVEKISFSTGSRYTIRLHGSSSVDLHIVGRRRKVFVELWLRAHASPVLVLEYEACARVSEVMSDILRALSMLQSQEARRQREARSKW